MIFVDTGAWYATAVTNDVDHLAAREWLAANQQALVTSDYVIDETLTLLKMRGYPLLAFELGRMLMANELAEIVMVGHMDFQQAWHIFQAYRDKGWSFTDCTSKAVMERLAIRTAFSFDVHFRQFGSVNVVP